MPVDITSVRECTIGGEIRRRAELQPNQAAIVGSGFAPLTYRELQYVIDEARTALRLAGFDRSARIAVAMRNGPQAALTIVAVACSAVSIPINPRQAISEIELCFAAIRPEAVLVAKGADSAARRAAERKCITIIEADQSKDNTLSFRIAAPKASDAAATDGSDEPDADAAAFILQTSGTVAGPKLIPVSHRIVLAAAEREQLCYELTPLDRCLSVTPIWYAYGLLLPVVTPLLTGGSVAFPANALEVNLSQWFSALMPTWYSAGPTLHLSILERMESQTLSKSLHALRFILTGGALLPPKLHKGLQSIFEVPLLDRYGASETQLISTNRPPPGPSKPGTCGIPWPDTVIIIGEDERPLAPGERGEILVRGATVISGYLDAPELNRRRFVDGWFRTGDIGSIDEDGFLSLHGRIDDVINRGGEKISPVEIDEALMRHPAVAEAAAYAVPHPRLGEDVAAAVVLRSDRTATPVELRGYLKEQLASHKVPRRISVRDQLPKGYLGKIVRRKLPEWVEEQAAAETARPKALATSHLSDVVRQAWIGVLSVESFDADAEFDAAGGDSFKGVDLLVRLEEMLGRHIPVGTLGLETRPSELIQRLSEAAAGADPTPDAMRPLIVFFPAMWGDDVSTSDFYRHLSQHFEVMAIESRLGGDALVGDYDVARYFAAAFAAIRRTGPPLRLWLVGYSYGGRLAAETARQLLASGTPVEAVISLDGEAGISYWRFNAAEYQQRRGVIARLRSGLADHGGVGRYLLNGLMVRVAPFAARHRANRILKVLLAFVHGFGSAETYRIVSREVVALTRQRAFGNLPAGNLPMAIWLFVTDDPRHDLTRPDMGWGDRCQEVHRISVGGMHNNMLSPPTREVIIAELTRLEVALRGKSTAEQQASNDQ